MPAISRAQSDAIKIGHLTPRTGFLGPLGDFAVQGIQLAAEEINAAGGVNGRKIDLVLEDSVNPQTASAKAERLVERDKVAMIIGEISSASGLAIGQVAKRTKTVFINTGCNSDALRGSDCNQYMFHIEAANSMYVQAVGQYLLKENMVKGKKWYSLTADYAFGHDLLKVAKRFMEANGGQFAADELVPTDASDFSPFLLKIRQARPDPRGVESRGNQITNFLKQYSEYGLPFPVAGFGFDTAVAWGLGKGKLLRALAAGVAPPDRYADLEELHRGVSEEVQQAAREPVLGRLLLAQDRGAIDAETKSTDPIKLAEHLRKGAKFDIGKAREGYFRAYDNQMDDGDVCGPRQGAAKMKDQWDIYEALGTVPGAGDDLEVIAPPKDGVCKIG
jgi:branched-chain amino acid transport system substrate-binding protein